MNFQLVHSSHSDDLYLEFHDFLFSLIRTEDVNTVREKSEAFEQQLTKEVTELEAQAANKQSKLSTTNLPPNIQSCLTAQPLGRADIPSSDEEEEDDSETNTYNRNSYRRLRNLLTIQGYGLDDPEFKRTNTNYRPATNRSRKITSIADPVVSANIREQFREKFDPEFFPKSFETTAVYLPRTIFENHSARFQAKKHIRPDRDTLSGLIVSLRKDPPPWAFID